MSLSAFLVDRDAILIADASVVININASGESRRIIEAISSKILVPTSASVELEIGARFGHTDGRQLDELVAERLIDRVEIGTPGLVIYEALIDGSFGQTLDDGEAATIAIAVERGAIALLDEKKARKLCADHFPDLTLGSSAEILTHEVVAAVLGRDAHSQAVMNALQKGRMRVPASVIESIIKIIGPEQAAGCTSLPRLARNVAG